MGRKKSIRVWTVFFVIFLVGGLAWLIQIQVFSRTEEFSGKKYGSPNKPIVLEFQTRNRYDYWEISFRTLGYNDNDFEVRIYKMDHCNYEWYLEGGTPYEYENLPEHQESTLKIRPEYKTNCEDDNRVYVVWDIQEGTVIADIDSIKVYFFTMKGFYSYVFVGLGIFGLLLSVIIYRSNHLSKSPPKYPKIVKALTRQYKKRNFCGLCGNEIQKNVEYCPYCGKIYTPPDLDKIKSI